MSYEPMIMAFDFQTPTEVFGYVYFNSQLQLEIPTRQVVIGYTYTFLVLSYDVSVIFKIIIMYPLRW